MGFRMFYEINTMNKRVLTYLTHLKSTRLVGRAVLFVGVSFSTARYFDIPVFPTADFIPNSNSQLLLEILMLFFISIC